MFSAVGRVATSLQALAVLTTGAVVLSGCVAEISGRPNPVVTGGGPSAQVFEQVEPPQLGTCLDTKNGGAGPLGPPTTLPCSEPHGGEIAKVVDVPDQVDGAYPTQSSLDSDVWSNLLYGDEGCGASQLVSAYLGAREQDNLLVDYYSYLPKRVAWEAGARWVACVVEYSLGSFGGANAPGLMALAMRGPDSAAYRECWFGPETVYDVVPCSQPHEAEPSGDYAVVDDEAPFPVDALDRQPLVDQCRDRVVDYLEGDVPSGYLAGIYLPTEQEWSDFPIVECVILDSRGRRTTGSAADA